MTDVPRHQCLIYDDEPSVHIPAIARSIRANLEANYRCLYFNSHAMISAMQDWLTADGLDLSHQISTGALVMSNEREQLVDGIFNIEKMLALLDIAYDQALTDGCAGLWSTGDVRWELSGAHNFDKLFDYERRLDEFLRNHEKFSCVCQYHKNSLPPGSINTALELHPAIYVSNTLAHENTFYKLN